QANTIHAMCTTTIFNLFSAVCYFFVIRKLVQLKRERRRDQSSREWTQEISMTIVGFSTFVSLCLATAYFAASYYAVMTKNVKLTLLATIRDFNVVHYFAMAFVNPWMLLITSGSIRK
ncbi:hypothetical protein PFISCL1PPCAC_21913, partial [Pristionchus fissidentatus]